MLSVIFYDAFQTFHLTYILRFLSDLYFWRFIRHTWSSDILCAIYFWHFIWHVFCDYYLRYTSEVLSDRLFYSWHGGCGVACAGVFLARLCPRPKSNSHAPHEVKSLEVPQAIIHRWIFHYKPSILRDSHMNGNLQISPCNLTMSKQHPFIEARDFLRIGLSEGVDYEARWWPVTKGR
jgi:hypothetical protein